MDISDIIAIIAIVVSITSVLYQWKKDLKLNAVNLEAEYFQKIYERHLLSELPKARKYIFFSNNKLKDYDKLMDELNAIRNDSLYFMYSDKKYYENLKNALQELEDYLGNCGNKEFSKENQDVIFNDIQEKIEEIYNIIISKYHGK